MIGRERLEMYRKMTPEERWREVREMMRSSWEWLLRLPPEDLDKRLALIRRQHDEGNELIAKKLREMS